MAGPGLLPLLRAVAEGSLPPEEAARRLQRPFADVLGARVDLERAERCGVPEVIYGAGKTPAELRAVAAALLDAGQPVLATRLDDDGAAALLALPGARHDPRARCVFAPGGRPAPPLPGRLLLVSAGTTDGPVLAEARFVAEALGAQVDVLVDVGVAGLHRLLHEVERLRSADVLVVVAGMEGALPSVVAGLVDRPVIAVPTSVGYGASFEGLTALLAMLASCAAGVTVVNVDNGFGAAVAAAAILRGLRR